jgi:hypothetical protein
MRIKDIPAGTMFTYANVEDDGLKEQCQFIRLINDRLGLMGQSGSVHRDLPRACNVLNVATWTAAIVDDDEELKVLGNARVSYFPAQPTFTSTEILMMRQGRLFEAMRLFKNRTDLPLIQVKHWVTTYAKAFAA